MSQDIFKNPYVSSSPVLTGPSIGNGTLTIDRLTHFTINQNYSAICTAIAPFTVFKIIGDLDGSVGVAVVGVAFNDQDLKLFATINQGPTLFEIGDTFEFSVAQGSDLTRENLDNYDELPQKNFGAGTTGSNSGDHNLRFTLNSIDASLSIGDLNFTSKKIEQLGNKISIEYKKGSVLNTASLTIQDILYTSVNSGLIGNNISIEYEDFTPSITSNEFIQDIEYVSRLGGVVGDLINITYTGGGTYGSEVVTLVGNDLSIQIEDGVSTPDSIRFAIVNAPLADALVQTIALGVGNELQTIHPQTFLTGGVDAIGDAGNEIITVVGSSIKIKAEDGVSTAQQINDAITANVNASLLVIPTITGGNSNPQTTIVAPINLINGADDIGLPGAELVEVIGDHIVVTFNDGLSDAQQIKTALESNLLSNDLITIGLNASGSELQASPFIQTYLKGGRPNASYVINTKELTDPSAFYEGNANLLVKDLITQGILFVSGESTFKNKVTLDDDTLSNLSGPVILNTQKTINDLINSKNAFVFTNNNGKIIWSNPAGTLEILDDLIISFGKSSVFNTIQTSFSPFTLADGEHLYAKVNFNVTLNITPIVGTDVPNDPEYFRIASRVGDSLIWWDNTLQRSGKIIRIGEGYSTPITETPIGVVDGINTDYIISNPPIDGSLMLFLNGLNDTEYSFTLATNTITLNSPPVLGQVLKVKYETI